MRQELSEITTMIANHQMIANEVVFYVMVSCVTVRFLK